MFTLKCHTHDGRIDVFETKSYQIYRPMVNQNFNTLFTKIVLLNEGGEVGQFMSVGEKDQYKEVQIDNMAGKCVYTIIPAQKAHDDSDAGQAHDVPYLTDKVEGQG